MNGRQAIFWTVFSSMAFVTLIIAIPDIQPDNFPVESETSSSFTSIKHFKNDKVEFDYNGYTMKFNCDRKQYQRIYHALNKDWTNRFDHTYRFTYRGDEYGGYDLLSFYRTK